MRACLLAIPLLAAALPALATVHHVPAEYANLQAAIDACAAGDTVLVASGTYTGAGNRDLDFGGTNLVLRSVTGAAATIIDCEALGRGLLFAGGEDSTAVVTGFTILDGRGCGGGVLCLGASPTLRDLCVLRCEAYCSVGGGMACFAASPRIENVIFAENVSRGEGLGLVAGGGLYCEDASPRLTGVRFRGNATRIDEAIAWENESLGGALCSLGSGHPVVEGCVFLANEAHEVQGEPPRGGGVYAAGPVTIRSTTFVDNLAAFGSAVSAADARLEQIVAAFGRGGWALDGAALLSCSDLYGNAGGDYAGAAAGLEGVAGNISADPWFCDPQSDTASVSSYSPCLPENNDCGLLMGAGGLGCYGGPAPGDFAASEDRYDGVWLSWSWSGGATQGFRIWRDGQLIYAIPDPNRRYFLDESCAVGGHGYTIRAHGEAGDGPGSYAEGERLLETIVITEPAGGEVLVTGDPAWVRWEHASDVTAVDVLLSRSGPAGPWEGVLAATPNDGEETWVPAGEGSEDCYLRIVDAYSAAPADTTDAPFTVYDRTKNVPAEYATLQAAIDACTDGDTVLVAPGFYTGEGNRNLDFGGTNLVLLSEAGPAETFIDCGGFGRGLHIHSGEDSTCVVQGFTIQKGNEDVGSGILCRNSSPRFRDLVIRYNRTEGLWSGGGAGAYIRDSDVRMVNILFDDNEASAWSIMGTPYVHGGGLCCDHSTVTLDSVVFRNNQTLVLGTGWTECCPWSAGGGMAIWGVCTVVLRYALFEGNVALAYDTMWPPEGGGLNFNGGGTATLSNVTFVGNRAGRGAAVHGRDGLSADACIFAWNEEVSPIHGDVQLMRSVFWQNDGDASDWVGHDGNFTVDPQFCDPEAGDYFVEADSPCLPENNAWGLLIGAWGQGCEDTPVALALFAAEAEPGAVSLRWEADGAVDFRLEGRRDGAAWEVAWEETAPGAFAARDEAPALAAAGTVSYALHGRETGGAWSLLRRLEVTVPGAALATRLLAPHPNPFNPRVTVPFTLAAPGPVRVAVFDLAGRRVAALLDAPCEAGRHELAWDGRDGSGRPQASGVYLLRFEAPGRREARRLVLLR
ncbi:MAG: hypothetical protein JW819_01795 [Candidatus Krumholzibacteriota bacterium]|nr:hypothetical protein [Candidatus Krumholzibacteriota bacterium]